MSYSIDFHFALSSLGKERWITGLDARLRYAGLQRLAIVQPLVLDDEDEVDVDFPEQRAESISDAEKLAASSYGIALHFASADADLAFYVWRQDGLRVVASMDYRQWQLLRTDTDAAFRLGGILCAASAELASPFGFSMVNSTFQPQGSASLSDLFAALDQRTIEPDLAWVTEALAEEHLLGNHIGPERQIRSTIDGYMVILGPPR